MTTSQYHPFHMVNISPWPVTASISAMFLTIGMVSTFFLGNTSLLLIGLITMTLIMFQWWRDTTRESTTQGNHTIIVITGLKWGMILFIISEILFFLSFFWTFFHSSLSPSIEIFYWPPMNILQFNPFQIPLLNTTILLASGISITLAHHSMMEANWSKMTKSLLLTIFLALYFILVQAMEYFEASFSMADSIYGSIFFMATGFHGFHVIVGSIFLLICLFRHMIFHFSSNHHFGFEAAAWYWHFVDVVWLFLFLSIYWWGN
uniref:Cytochrome c oxidase subunit 3 n=1 Tax=Brachycybe lecontii TaxID=1176341 RepID=S4T038_BRALC|nr:cytochrome c oxidase subunit III [Brachycybe lecontii]AFR77041.1 cytochrome c oxidase subunit III [Brachycybe lecontii]